MAPQAAATNRSLDDCPTNVKEALEWLEALEQRGGATQCVKVIKKILKDFNDDDNATKLCDAAKKFLSAIKINGENAQSTYKGAQWSDLCKNTQGGANCCASTGGRNGCTKCNASKSSCDGCCYDCPKIKCARIFCLILPIVYYFLEYLKEKCQGEWERQQVDGNDSYGNQEKDLCNFMQACGFNSAELNGTKKGYEIANVFIVITPKLSDLKEALKNAFKDTNAQQSFLARHHSDQSATKEPSTIRDMMLWLQGLPYCPQFNELTKKIQTKCNAINKSGSNGVTCEKVMESLLDNICRLPGMFLTVEGTSSHLMKDLMDGCLGTQPTQCFLYKNGEDLLQQFCEYTYKVHTQLRFLKVMCTLDGDKGGWEYCTYANGSCNCSTTVKTSCLKLFLQNGNSGSGSGANGNKFKLCKAGDQEENKMGFKPHEPQNGNIIGRDIQDFLEPLLDEIPTPPTASSPSTSKPLSLLTQYCVAIGQLHPQSLGELFAFFAHLGKDWDQLKLYNNGQKFETQLQKELTECQIGKYGIYAPCDQLKTKIKDILTTHNSHDDKKDLMSLMCNNTGGSNSCAPYMKSLSQGLYHYYCPEITGAGEPTKFGAFQYLYDMLKKLLDKMKELKKEFEACECCKPSGSQTCTGLIQCPNAHPILYKFGFVFGDPKALKSGSKKCETLKAQIGNVLSCEQKSESALFSAFECVIQVTYSILLQKAKEKVKDAESGWNGVTSKDITKDTITIYVENAMDQSKNKFDCTFLCKLFNGNTECNKHNSQSQASSSQTEQIVVTKSTVTAITAVIPQYTAPVIDPYHYRTFQEATTTDGKSSATYNFQSALDFHISGANCIRPTPVALRSVIDWILRVTTGAIATGALATQEAKENGNNNIKQLSDAIKEVLKDSGVSESDVQPYVTDLVDGLRKFMGYQDRSTDVKEGVKKALGDAKETNNNGVKKLLDAEIKKITDFIGQEGSKSFGSELGKALLKGRYDVKGDHIMNLVDAVIQHVDIVRTRKYQHGTPFMSVIKMLQKKLSVEHHECGGLNCTDFQPKNSADSSSNSGSGTVTAQGLKDLYTFFEQLKSFAALWDSIGKQNGGAQPNTASSSVVHNQKAAAATEVSNTIKPNGSQGSSPSNGDYFTKLYEALTKLGQCAQKVQALENKNGSVTNSQQYREKISDLIEGLKEFGQHIKDCNFNGSQATGENNNASDPVYAVKGAEELIKKTVSNVEIEITSKIKEGVEGKYEGQNGNCTVQPAGTHTQHNGQKDFICIQSLITLIEGVINSKCDEFKSHLDDLKQLCQWLYRMAQLYAHGLKGFVESLISHLGHILQTIIRVEQLHKYATNINNWESYDGDIFPNYLKDLIANLLHSYILKDADKSLNITDDKASTYRQLLSHLRLLALDRYTLQVWQDECNSTSCNIRDWITFKDGIIRHSDLNAIKQQLSVLTGISYSSNTASSIATPSASRSRIHDFHAICVIQKFSYEPPITRLERSLEKLQEIKEKLSEVKVKCDGQTDVSSDPTVTTFCDSVSQFLDEPYGVFNLANFLHTILGPNIFSAVIGALEELKNKDHYKPKTQNGGNGNLDKIKGILGVMTEGLDGENNKEHYTLTHICDKLQDFISTLRREYIFAYPVVTCTATQAIASPPNPQPKTPTCPNRDHSKSSICSRCYPYLARIFIGAIPNLYRHCRLLYEMCNIGPGYSQEKILSMGYEDYYNRYMLSLSVYMSHQGYEVLTRGKDGVMHPSAFKHELNPALPGGHVFEKLKAIVSIKDPLTNIPDDPNSLKPLDQLFKAVMQHFTKERNKKRGEREKKEKDAFETKYKDSGLKFVAPPAPLPSTVRQVLFWLHEMDTQGEFYKQLCDHIFTLCKQSSIQIYDGVITHLLKLSATQCLEVLATIEDPERQNPQYYYELYTEEHYYAYPTVNIPLFLYTFVEKLMGAFLELNFVCVQCEFVGSQGGWKDCHIGNEQNGPGADGKKGTKCECVSTTPPKPSSNNCPRPLSAFLFSDQKNQLRIPGDVSQRLVYMSKGTMPCGFKLKNKAITDPATPSDAHTPTPTPTSVSGSVLVEPLRKLVGGHVTGRHNGTTTKNGLNTLSTVIYLRDLLRYTLCLAVRPPWSMSENMAFFYRVTESWKNKGAGSVTVAHPNANLLGAIHDEIALFPGSFKAELLTTAVERFAGIEDKHQNGTHSNMSHQYDLRTLMGCQESNTTSSGTTPAQCSTFMFPLSLDVYTHFDHKNSRAYLSWILNFAFGIYGQLKALEERMKESACVRNNTSQSTPQCPSLPMCPRVLSALYQSGSSFMDQAQLAKKDTNTGGANTTKKTCNDFHTVLSGLFNCNSTSCTPLHNLIVQCEAFLWSIRMPFSLVQLSLWSVAILFISYVFVVPLDHFKIKSHLFNRLKYTMHPSLLIADSQRRVSEVAYFSL